jgi:hypothetical protein
MLLERLINRSVGCAHIYTLTRFCSLESFANLIPHIRAAGEQAVCSGVARLGLYPTRPRRSSRLTKSIFRPAEYYLVGQRVSVYYNLNAIPARILKRKRDKLGQKDTINKTNGRAWPWTPR